ncbi:hypothetical protein BH11MYX2_BH11MYX2_32050 [soil metagenome]
MPTYEYRCNACGRNFEYVQRMADDDLVTCEVCSEPKLEKLISRTAFQLKGSGWYKDLYSSAPAQAMKDSVDKQAPPKTEAKADGASASPSSESSGSSSGGSSDSSGGGSTGGGSTGGGSTGGGSSGGGSSSTSSS